MLEDQIRLKNTEHEELQKTLTQKTRREYETRRDAEVL